MKKLYIQSSSSINLRGLRTNFPDIVEEVFTTIYEEDWDGEIKSEKELAAAVFNRLDKDAALIGDEFGVTEAEVLGLINEMQDYILDEAFIEFNKYY